MSATAMRRPRLGLPGPLARVASGIGAVTVKELRGRMRGRRAFVVLTLYLLLLGGFAWAVELFLERVMTSSGQPLSSASAEVGRGVFIGLMLFETLLVTILAPAFTAGAISMEREKQTLDLLTATPISSLGIVVGKLYSALAYVFLLIATSLPLTAIVFVFGGVAPDDLVRGYLVLLVTAIGFGTVGLFFSALLKRTQAATVVTYVVVLALTLGSLMLWGFWTTMVQQASGPVVMTRDLVLQDAVAANGRVMVGDGPGVTLNDTTQPGQDLVLPRRAPAVLLWLDPFIAQLDVFCGTETSNWGTCSIIGEITGRPVWTVDVPQAAPAPIGGVNGPAVKEPAPVQADPLAPFRDTFWPVFTVAWLVVSAVLVLASVQLVAPTRRWRLRRPRRHEAATETDTAGDA